MKSIVIPAKAGIQWSASARHKRRQAFQPATPVAFYAHYRERWIPVFAGMTMLCFVLLLPTLALAEEVDNTSHLPLPRFASLRSGEVNMRTGPGTRDPIAWVYTRRGLPVEVIAEYDIWRRVRDPAGTEGWVNKTELTGKREAVVTGIPRELHKEADDKTPVVAHLQTDAMGQIMSCTPDWCKLKFDDVKGYLRKTDFWGAYPNEKFD